MKRDLGVWGAGLKKWREILQPGCDLSVKSFFRVLAIYGFAFLAPEGACVREASTHGNSLQGRLAKAAFEKGNHGSDNRWRKIETGVFSALPPDFTFGAIASAPSFGMLALLYSPFHPTKEPLTEPPPPTFSTGEFWTAESSSATFQNLEDFLILQMPDQNISDFSIWNTCRLGLDAIVATSPRCCHDSAALMAAIHFKTFWLTVVVRRPPCFSSRLCLCSCTLCRNVLKRSALNGQESWLAAGSTLISFESFQFFSIDWWDVLWFHHAVDKSR